MARVDRVAAWVGRAAGGALRRRTACAAGRRRTRRVSPGAMVQMQLDQLEDDLRMTPAQLGAWRIYADKVQKLADDTARSRLDARAATSTPADAGAAAGADRQRRAGPRERRSTRSSQAGRAFYATLTEDQKAIADRRLWLSVSLLATGVMPPGMSDIASRAGRRPAP